MSKLFANLRKAHKTQRDRSKRTPNARLRKALRDASERRELTYYDSLEDFRKSLLED